MHTIHALLFPTSTQHNSTSLHFFPFCFSFTHTFTHKVQLTCIYIHQLLFRPRRTQLCMHNHQAHMLMQSFSLLAHTAYRLLPANVFIISKRTPTQSHVHSAEPVLSCTPYPSPSPSGNLGIVTLFLYCFIMLSFSSVVFYPLLASSLLFCIKI